MGQKKQQQRQSVAVQPTTAAPAEKRVISVSPLFDEVRHVCRMGGVAADKAPLEVINLQSGHASCSRCGAAWAVRGKRGAR